MKTYKIYLKKTKKGVFEDVVLIKEGFIFWAFIFNVLWLFYKKVWTYGLLMLLVFGTLATFKQNGIVYPNVALAIQIGITLFIGFEAGDWYEKSLKKRGYYFLGYSSGRNSGEARLRFLDKINADNQKAMKIKVF